MLIQHENGSTQGATSTSFEGNNSKNNIPSFGSFDSQEVYCLLASTMFWKGNLPVHLIVNAAVKQNRLILDTNEACIH